MTKDELETKLIAYKQGFIGITRMMYEVDQYTSALLKQCNVSGSLPLVEQSLLDEAISDVITISRLNRIGIAKKLISEQFYVADKRDLFGGNER